MFFRVFGTTVEEDYEDSDQQDATQQDDLDPLSGKEAVDTSFAWIMMSMSLFSIQVRSDGKFHIALEHLKWKCKSSPSHQNKTSPTQWTCTPLIVQSQ